MDKYITLYNGVKVPQLGLGTWLITGEECERAVKDALSLGYRHIDTAQAYGNEAEVGKAIRESGIAREEIFLTTKLIAEAKDEKSARAAIEGSFEKLGSDYLDLLIIHSPQPWSEFRGEKRYFEENKAVWRVLEEYYESGRIKAIGVSNFLLDDLESLLSACRIKPMVNQVLSHASNTPFEILDFCKREGIAVEAYSPIAHGAVLKDALIMALSEKYGVSPARICLEYDVQLGLIVLPKSSSKAHLEDNMKLDFTISDEDMEALRRMETIKDYGKDSFFPVFGGKL